MSEDFDHDGMLDLAAGYMTSAGAALVLYRGNLDAFAPRNQASFQAIGRAQFPSPFRREATVIAVPDRPDFLASGVFRASGDTDLILTTRGGSTIDVLWGDGTGGFQLGQSITTPGPVSALGSVRINPSEQNAQLLVAVHTSTGPQLLVYRNSPDGLVLAQTVGLNTDASDFKVGELDGDSFSDVLIVGGGTVSILHGSDLQAGATIQSVDTLPLNFEVSGAALGIFIHTQDARLQIALLATDGGVHLWTHTDFDPRPLSKEQARNARNIRSQVRMAARSTETGADWQEVENFPGVAPFNATAPPLIFRTRVLSNNSDDVMILNAAGGQTAVIGHPNPVDDLTATSFPPGVILTRPDSSSGAVAALPSRVNVDGRPGVLFLKPQESSLFAMSPLPDPTFIVNTFNDTVDVNPGDGNCADSSGQCSLRAAIMQANSDSGNDTILVPAGTYTLTLTGPNKEIAGETDAYGSLDIFHGLSIVGEVDSAGNPATIIRAGTNNTNGIDKVFAINPDSATAFDTSFSNLQIQFGRNPGSFSGGRVRPHGFGGGLSWQGNLTGNMSLTNCVVTDNSTLDGDGGGIAAESGGLLGRANGTGVFTITNSIVQRNSANESSTGRAGKGGGIWVGLGTALVITNSQITSNTTQAGGQGGGAFFTGPSNTTTQSQIHGSIINSNQSTGQGAGIYTTQGLRIDAGTIVKSNSGADQGGGIWSTSNGELTTLSRISISGNSATGQGGGIFSGSQGSLNQLFLTFSRMSGNTALAGSNLSALSGTVTATLNWWGTNSPIGTINGITTFDPFIVLTQTANPVKIPINQTSTLTGSFLQENHGNPIDAGNLTALTGVPITFNNAALGTIPEIQPESIQPTGTATAQFNAGGTAGQGHVDATVDNATITANILVFVPPPMIGQSFNPTNVIVSGTSTITFTITNPNAITLNTSFNDTLAANLLVASAPNAVNSCGGALLASPGSAAISFVNTALPPGTCTVKVDVTSGTDGIYNNSVTIGAVESGPGNTASASLTVINPPTIAKSFAAPTSPLNSPVFLHFSISNSNVNSSVNGVAFTDSLPSGMVVATPQSFSNTCGGTVNAISGSGSVSLSGASVQHGASCNVFVSVIGTVPGLINNSVTISSVNGGAGNTSNASISLIAAPTLQQSFGAATIPVGGTTTLSFSINNPNVATPLTGVGFGDTLPVGLVISTPNGLSSSCGGGITATQGTNLINLSGVTLNQNASCTVSVNVSGVTPGDQHNTATVVSVEGGSSNLSSANVSVVGPPSISAAFIPQAISLNGSSGLNFTVSNPTANTMGLTGVAFTDTLPAGLSAINGTSTVCGGTLSVSGANTIALTGATVAVNGSCGFNVTVTGTQLGHFTTTTTPVLSNNGGSGNTTSASLTIATPPSIAMSFAAQSIAVNQTTLLSFAITNPLANGTALTGIAFGDGLPSGLLIGAPSIVNNDCGGALTAVSGSSSVILSGGTLAAGGSCTVVVRVQGTSAGTKSNTTGSISSNESGPGGTSNTASLTVVGPPTVSATFGASSVPLNGTTLLTLTIANPNSAVGLTSVGVANVLPAGLALASGVTGTCVTGGPGVQAAGIATANQGSNSFSLAGLALTVSGSCSLSVTVTGVSAGLQTDTSGNVSAVFDSGAGQLVGITGGTASASLAVVVPPSISATFVPAAIGVNGNSGLRFTIKNPTANAVALTGVSFTGLLPPGLSAANGTSTVCGGTLSVSGGTTITLTGATIAANTNCAISVGVTGTQSGQFTTTTSAVLSTNGGAGNTASASLNVATPPTITESFADQMIALNQTTLLSFSIANPPANGTPLTGIAFIDGLPAGLVVGASGIVTNNCGGSLTAVAGSSSINLAGGTLATGASCSIVVRVQGTSVGTKVNVTGPISSNESGAGPTSNSASLNVVGPPTVSAVFGASSIPLNGTTSLTLTIVNPNTGVSITNIEIANVFPAGLASANGVTGTCISGGPGVQTPGTAAVNLGSNSVSLSGLSLAGSDSCSLSVTVTGATPGLQVDASGNVSASFDSGSGQLVAITGGTASASVTIIAPPTIGASFGSPVIAPTTSTVLTVTITNPVNNNVPLIGVAFTDTFPTRIVIGTPNGLTNSCGGTATAAAGSGSLSLAGGTVGAGMSCTLSVNVTGTVVGAYTNTTAAVTSSNGGAGNAASANIAIQVADLTISASHAGTFAHGQTNGNYSLVVTNSGQGPTLGQVSVTDGFPSNLTALAISGQGWSCTLSSLSCTRSDVLAPGGSYPAILITASISYSSVQSVVNTAIVGGGGEANLSNDSASDPTTLTSGTPALITAFAGTPQTLTDSASASPFQAFVADAGGFPSAGVTVTFVAAGGVFSGGGATITAVTNTQGIATSPVFLIAGTVGVYQATATVAGVSQTATFLVTLIQTNLVVTPSVLSFVYNAGDPNPTGQTINITEGTSFTVSMSYTPTNAWLAASRGATTPTSAAVNVSVNPTGLTPGTYVGSVLLVLGSRQVTVGATLTVLGPPALVSSPGSLTFAALSNQGSPPSQTFVLGSQNRNVGFAIGTSSPWIVASSSRSTTPATLVVTVDPTGFSPGATVTGSVQITAQGAMNSPLSIPVTMTVSSGLAITPGSAENAASLQPAPGAPNTIMTLYGSFACGTGAQVLVNDQAAEVISTSSGVINFAFSGSVNGQTAAPVKVGCNGAQSSSVDIPIVPASPGIFTLSMAGTGQGAVLNTDLTVNGPLNPASVGGYLAVYGTGFGSYRTADSDGLQRLIYDVQAFVGDLPAHVQFAGHAPDFTMALQQINILIPPGASTGPSVPIRLVVNGVSTQAGVTVAIR